MFHVCAPSHVPSQGLQNTAQRRLVCSAPISYVFVRLASSLLMALMAASPPSVLLASHWLCRFAHDLALWGADPWGRHIGQEEAGRTSRLRCVHACVPWRMVRGPSLQEHSPARLSRTAHSVCTTTLSGPCWP